MITWSHKPCEARNSRHVGTWACELAWHVDTLVRKHVKHVDTWGTWALKAGWHVSTIGTLARVHIRQVSTWAYKHARHVGTQDTLAREHVSTQDTWVRFQQTLKRVISNVQQYLWWRHRFRNLWIQHTQLKNLNILKREINLSKKNKFNYTFRVYDMAKNSFLAEVTFQEIFELSKKIKLSFLKKVTNYYLI